MTTGTSVAMIVCVILIILIVIGVVVYLFVFRDSESDDPVRQSVRFQVFQPGVTVLAPDDTGNVSRGTAWQIGLPITSQSILRVSMTTETGLTFYDGNVAVPDNNTAVNFNVFHHKDQGVCVIQVSVASNVGSNVGMIINTTTKKTTAAITVYYM